MFPHSFFLPAPTHKPTKAPTMTPTSIAKSLYFNSVSFATDIPRFRNAVKLKVSSVGSGTSFNADKLSVNEVGVPRKLNLKSPNPLTIWPGQRSIFLTLNLLDKNDIVVPKFNITINFIVEVSELSIKARTTKDVCHTYMIKKPNICFSLFLAGKWRI